MQICHRSMASWLAPRQDLKETLMSEFSRIVEVSWLQLKTLIETSHFFPYQSFRLSARWPKTTSPFAIGRPPQRRQRGNCEVLFGPLFFTCDSLAGGWAFRNQRENSCFTLAKAKVGRGWSGPLGVWLIRCPRIQKWIFSNHSWVEAQFYQSCSRIFCPQNSMQFLRLKYLSKLRFAPVEFSVGQFLHFWGSVQLSPGWLELNVFLCTRISRRQGCVFFLLFLKMCGYQVCVCWHHCLW